MKAELAAAYSKAGLMDKNPSVVAEGILFREEESGGPLSMRMVKNLVAVYARDPGSIEKGLDLLTRSDLKAFSYREILGKSKVIHFSTFLCSTTWRPSMADAYLEKAAGDPKVRDAVEFHLGQAYALFGSIEESSKVTASFITASQMPQSYKDRIRVWQGANLYARNRRADAMAVWDELMQKRPGGPGSDRRDPLRLSPDESRMSKGRSRKPLPWSRPGKTRSFL